MLVQQERSAAAGRSRIRERDGEDHEGVEHDWDGRGSELEDLRTAFLLKLTSNN